MRINIIWRSMCCPAGVPDADISVRIFFSYVFFKVANFAFAFVNVKSLIQNGNARAVVSSVFKAVKSFDKNRIRFFISDVCYYAAHKLVQSFHPAGDHPLGGKLESCKLNNQKLQHEFTKDIV